MRMTERSGLQVVWGIRMAGRNQEELEWIVTRGGRVGAEWNVREWKSEIDSEVCGTKHMEEWYGTKEHHGMVQGERSPDV